MKKITRIILLSTLIISSTACVSSKSYKTTTIKEYSNSKNWATGEEVCSEKYLTCKKNTKHSIIRKSKKNFKFKLKLD